MSTEEELAPRRLLKVRDEDTGDLMDMEVFIEIDFEEHTYALITSPVPMVHLFEVARDGDQDSGEALSEVDDATFNLLRKDINEHLKQWGVTIEMHGTELRLSDELPEQVYADSPLLEIDAEEEAETFMQLFELDRGDKLYWLMLPTPPPLYPVELVGDEARFLEDEELERLQPIFDEALEDIDDEDFPGDDEGAGRA